MSPLTEASNVFGWMSIACWILVYSPQVYENYDLQSGEGLSVLFVVIWLLGDLTNLFGAVMAGLIPTVIILALYYTICDIILLGQIYYYRWKRLRQTMSSVPSENTQLLSSPSTSKSTLESWLPAPKIRYYIALLFVVGTGVSAWYINHPHGPNGNIPHDTTPVPDTPEEIVEWKSQVLGWISACLYIGSRVPQLLKNRETKCQGLSLALFVFAVAGNALYALSILVATTSMKHIIANASWLAGSILTIFLDIIVFYQFVHYREERKVLEAAVKRTHSTSEP